MSPLLFCFIEDVIRRSLSKLIRDGKLKLMHGTRDINIPSHILYVDDMMIFFRDTNSIINALKNVFIRYVVVSGQLVNPHKSSIFVGSMSPHRVSQISNMIVFNIGTLPFTYLGVPIFIGKPKCAYFQPIAD